MRYEQYPENPKFADADYAAKWLNGEFNYMNEQEQEEVALRYGPRKLRKAIKKCRKEEERARNACSSEGRLDMWL